METSKDILLNERLPVLTMVQPLKLGIEASR